MSQNVKVRKPREGNARTRAGCLVDAGGAASPNPPRPHNNLSQDVIRAARREYNELRCFAGVDYPKGKCKNLLELFEVLNDGRPKAKN